MKKCITVQRNLQFGRSVSDQEKLLVLKRELVRVGRRIWVSVILLWVIVLASDT